MRDHGIDCLWSKNQLVATLDGVLASLNATFSGGDQQRFTNQLRALAALREELASESRPTFPEGTWRRLIQAVNVSDQPKDYMRDQFETVVAPFRFLQPDQVR